LCVNVRETTALDERHQCLARPKRRAALAVDDRVGILDAIATVEFLGAAAGA
jgi:hypothetical protein